MAEGVAAPRRLGVHSAGFLRQPALCRILALAGWQVRPGIGRMEAIGVWGRSRTHWRGRLAARLTGLPVLTIEDAFLRSLHPGQTGEAPLGLVLDDVGIHFDAGAPSRLERILAGDDLPEAEAELALWRSLHLSKYNAWDPGAEVPEPGFVLVADQSAGDAAIRFGAAGPDSFATMLRAAVAENPGQPVYVRTHPDVAAGRRRGHFGPLDAGGQVRFLTGAANPARVLAAAGRVYCVTSQLGFEAILAGHRPRVFGQPFYAGWGLCEGEVIGPRRGRLRSPGQLFAAALLRYPVWHDPFADRLTDFATVARILAHEASQWEANAAPSHCTGMRLWKRRVVAGFLAGPGGPARFAETPAQAVQDAAARGGRVVVWAGKSSDALVAAARAQAVPLWRMEDGFLRSLGLGAALVTPASLVLDDLGIYYDPARPSRLERLIAASPGLPAAELVRAAALRAGLVAGGVTKYGAAAGAGLPEDRRCVLVPGQVADDASVRLGAGAVRDNAGLLAAARAARPEAFLVYRPHPDVTAGLRPGAIRAEGIADAVIAGGDPAAILARADEVWTMTSLMGFEALLRGVPVTCLGLPFYAGWGLTTDLCPVPDRRGGPVSLDGLTHAALIGYPRYRDPVTGRACTAEVILARLAARDPGMARGPDLRARLLSRLQGRVPGLARLWR